MEGKKTLKFILSSTTGWLAKLLLLLFVLVCCIYCEKPEHINMLNKIRLCLEYKDYALLMWSLEFQRYSSGFLKELHKILDPYKT